MTLFHDVNYILSMQSILVNLSISSPMKLLPISLNQWKKFLNNWSTLYNEIFCVILPT